MYMMIEMSDLFGFVKDLEKIIYGLGSKLVLDEFESGFVNNQEDIINLKIVMMLVRKDE